MKASKKLQKALDSRIKTYGTKEQSGRKKPGSRKKKGK